MSNGPMVARAVPSTAVMVMSPLDPKSLDVGVPASVPVVASKVAQSGRPTTVNDTVPCGLVTVAVGVNA